MRPTRRPTLAPEAVTALRELHARAETSRRNVAADSPARRASQQLNRELLAYVRSGVTLKHLADVLDMTTSAVSQRVGPGVRRG